MNFTLATPLLTGRVMIRLAEQDDLDALLPLHSDAEVTRYIPHVHWATRADADAWYARLLERREKQSSVQCVIVKRATAHTAETVIGTALLFNFEAASGLAEVGYLLGREHWGQGYALEAITAFIDFAFSTLDLRRLEATVDSRNVASNRLLQRLGFVREGVLRERWLAAGELQDINLHALLKREWRA
jgi:[ribosomal protein S5]-alanine N-acetyltransferase